MLCFRWLQITWRESTEQIQTSESVHSSGWTFQFNSIRSVSFLSQTPLLSDKSAAIWDSNYSETGDSPAVSTGQYGLPFQWVVTVYWSSVHDVHPSPNTPHAADWGCPLERGLVLPSSQPVVNPTDILLPLCPEAIPCHWDSSIRPYPALLAKTGTLLLVVLLPVGNTADGTMGRAFVDVLVWHFLFLPIRSILGQCPT